MIVRPATRLYDSLSIDFGMLSGVAAIASGRPRDRAKIQDISTGIGLSVGSDSCDGRWREQEGKLALSRDLDRYFKDCM